MAANEGTITEWLKSLDSEFSGAAAKEYKNLLQVKRSYCKKKKLDFDGQINSWDIAYYTRKATEEMLNFTFEQAREFFPLDLVLERTLSTLSQLLELEFVPIPIGVLNDRLFWHEDVLMYQVLDTRNGNTSKDAEATMGYMFLDLYERDGMP